MKQPNTPKWQLGDLMALLLSDDLLKHRANHALVVMVTHKLIEDEYGNEYDGFALGPVCGDKNLVVVSFHGCGPVDSEKEPGSDRAASCIRTMVHELAHTIGAVHDYEGDHVMRQPFELDSKPTKMVSGRIYRVSLDQGSWYSGLSYP